MTEIDSIQPIIVIYGNKTSIENLTADLQEVRIALASGTAELGLYNGTQWVWISASGTTANHNHLGITGDGGTFDAANLTSATANNGDVLTADGFGGAAWEVPSIGSGDVATDTIWDAKGDLAVGTGANTAAKLTVGTDGKVLTAASGEATGLKWDTPAGGGDVTGPATSADGHLAVWDGTNSKTLKDGGDVPAAAAPSLLLNYAPTTDTLDLTTMTSGSWYDVCANQNFTVSNASAQIAISVSGFLFSDGSTGANYVQAVIDSGGTPVTVRLGGTTVPSNGAYINPLVGCNLVSIGTLSAATHTIKVQITTTNTGNRARCKYASNAPEFIRVQVWQMG